MKVTANEQDGCNITLVFAWMGAAWILPVCIECKNCSRLSYNAH